MPDSNKTTGTTSRTLPGMNDILGAAKYIFNSGQGFMPNQTSLVTPFSTQTSNALKGMANASTQAIPGFQNQYNQLSATLQDQGLNTKQDESAGWLRNIASGGEQNGNPYLDTVLNATKRDIADAVNLNASVNGRYGSGSHDNILQRNIGDVSSRMRMDDYNNQLARRDAAIRSYFDVGGQQRQNMIDAPGQLAAGFNASMSPLQQLGKVGEAYEQKNQQVLNDQNRVFNETKNSLTNPIDWLANNAAKFQGGSVSTSTPYNPALSGIGGALGGYSAFGPVGGILGGLGGLFGL